MAARGLELAPLGVEHLEAAAALLAHTHSRHRQHEPLLPDRYEDPAEARAVIEGLLDAEGATAVVALRGGVLAGYMVGAPRSNPVWGDNRWVDVGGHAVDDPEVVRDLYAALAGGWVNGGARRHWAMVPAFDRDLVDAWSRLSFGQQQANGIREVPAGTRPDGVREARAEDIESLVELSYVLPRHMAASPVFNGVDPSQADASREDLLEEIQQDTNCSLVAVDGDHVVGGIVVMPVEESGGGHVTLARPDGEALLAWAGVSPEARGTGAGVRLTEAAFAWAHERGHRTMVTDWRVANLEASRFWPRRGFRTTYLRMYRAIP